MVTPAEHITNSSTKPIETNKSFFGGGGSVPFFQARPGVQCKETNPSEAHPNMIGHTSDAGGKAAPSIVSKVLSSGGGQPMDGSTRQFMESRFGQNFSHVRIHTDIMAAESANAIQARAYTSGRDVVFGNGEYQPSSERGKRLLAHELVHVGQQSNDMLMRQVSFTANKPQNTINPAAELKMEGGNLGTKLGSTIAFLNKGVNAIFLPTFKFDPTSKTCSFSEPTNDFGCDIYVPIKDPWLKQVDRTWASPRIKGAKEYFEEKKCSGSQINIIVEHPSDLDKKIQEITDHEKKHAKDMEDVYKTILEPWDTNLKQRIKDHSAKNIDTSEKCAALKAEETRIGNEIPPKLVSEISKKEQAFHRSSAGKHHVPLTPKRQNCENIIFKIT